MRLKSTLDNFMDLFIKFEREGGGGLNIYLQYLNTSAARHCDKNISELWNYYFKSCDKDLVKFYAVCLYLNCKRCFKFVFNLLFKNYSLLSDCLTDGVMANF